MKRRAILAGIAASGLPVGLAMPVHPQSIARVAWISAGTAAIAGPYLAAFREGMRDNGLAEGTDYVFDPYFADGNYERFPALVQAALARAPAAVLLVGSRDVQAVQRATRTVPIVFMATTQLKSVSASAVMKRRSPG